MHTLQVMSTVFREAFKELRLALGLSQFQAAVLLSVSPTQISRWENGAQAPHPLTQEAVLAKLRSEQRAKRRQPKPPAT